MMKINYSITFDDEKKSIEFNVYDAWFEVIINRTTHKFLLRLKYALNLILKGSEEIKMRISHNQAKDMMDTYYKQLKEIRESED